MIRNFFSLITAYVVFAATSVAQLKLTGQYPHGEATTSFKILTTM